MFKNKLNIEKNLTFETQKLIKNNESLLNEIGVLKKKLEQKMRK